MNSSVAASCSLTSRRIFLALSMRVPVIRMDVLYMQYSTAARGVQVLRGTADAASSDPAKSRVPGTNARTNGRKHPCAPSGSQTEHLSHLLFSSGASHTRYPLLHPVGNVQVERKFLNVWTVNASAAAALSRASAVAAAHRRTHVKKVGGNAEDASLYHR